MAHWRCTAAALLGVALAGCGARSIGFGPDDERMDAGGARDGAPGEAIAISPLGITVIAGATLQLEADLGAVDGGHRPLAAWETTWTSSAPLVATVDEYGVLHGLSPGLAIVTVRSGDLAASAPLAVVAPERRLVGLTIDPPAASTSCGGATGFQAFGHYDDGSVSRVTSTVQWDSSAPAVAMVSRDGVAHGAGEGDVQVVATMGVVHAAPAALRVVCDAVSAIRVEPASGALRVGSTDTLQLRATGVRGDGTTLDLTEIASWSSNAPGIADVSNAPGSRGLVSAGPASGDARITASAFGLDSTPGVISVH